MNWAEKGPELADSRLSFTVTELARLQSVAEASVNAAHPPFVFYLEGPLGAGKTTFVRAFAAALGYPGRVKSPTYGLLETYLVGDLHLLHLDLYRIENPEELEYLSLRDLFGDATLLMVEWPRRGQGELPPADVEFRFSESRGVRVLDIEARSQPGCRFVSKLSRQIPNSNLDDNSM